jgi:rhamnulokinase
MSRHYLACDFGAESGRLMLGTLSDDCRLSLEELHRFPNIPIETEECLSWNIPALWEEVQKGLQIAADRNLEICSISVDGWGVDYVLLDDVGEIISPTYCYRDKRNQRGVDNIFSQVSWEEVYAETGIQFLNFNTLYQLGAETQERLAQAKTIVPLGDAFNYLLSGVARTEISMASTSSIFDPRKLDWSDKLLKAAKIKREQFAPFVASGTVLGSLKQDLAEKSGLGKIQVVATCSHDTGAAVAAVPAEGENWAYLSSGTWSLIGVEIAKPMISDQSREKNYTHEIGHGNTIRFLRNIIGLWIVQECRRNWEKQGTVYDYDTLTQLAIEAEPFRSLINPDDQRFFNPENMLEAISRFCEETNQPIPNSPGAFVRCALESLALVYRSHLAEAEELTGRTIQKLHIVGGGSKNALLNQLAANATGREVIAGPTEATALGNIAIQAIALGHIEDLSAARKIVHNSMDVEIYQPQDSDTWNAAYSRFCSL